MGAIDKLREIDRAADVTLDKLRRVGAGGTGGTGGGSSSSGDMRRLRGDIQALGRQVAGIGGRGKPDPFLSDLERGGGPRRV